MNNTDVVGDLHCVEDRLTMHFPHREGTVK